MARLTQQQLDEAFKQGGSATAAYESARGRQADTEKQAKDEALRKFLQSGDLENNRLIAGDKLGEDSRHNREMERIGSQQANTTEGYRRDQATKMEEDARKEKLKILLGGNSAGGAVSGEQQKTLNLADNARNGLNETESLLKEHPIAGAIQTGLQSIPLVGDVISNTVAGVGGGAFKAIRDSKASTKESLQNLWTGAAASGEQVPAFQGFSGPGALDIARGKVDTSGGTRDAINTFQQRQQKAMPRLNQDMLNVSGMAQDPIAQQALKQQQEAAQFAREQKLQKMDPEDRADYQEAIANPQHPGSRAAIQYLTRKYGNLN